MTSIAAAFGHLKKLRITGAGDDPYTLNAEYSLRLDEEEIRLNDYLGQTLTLSFTGDIHCQACGRRSNKSFNQGYCYPCFNRLAECDACIMSPEKCHFHLDSCRDPAWGERRCMQDHYVYLANSSGLKVGITRSTQVPTRWLDQGAVQALPILKVSTRYQSGLVETLFKSHVTDRTAWQKMLKGGGEKLDMPTERDRLLALVEESLGSLEQRFGQLAIQRLKDARTTTINYPVLQYPQKVFSLNLDKQPQVSGTLLGLKGQYLILDTGVMNIRRFSAYQVEFKAS